MRPTTDEARLRRALRGYRRFRAMRLFFSILLACVAAVIGAAVAARHGILPGVVVFVVGAPVLGAVVGPIVMLPLGYLFCGRDAMTLGRRLEASRSS